MSNTEGISTPIEVSKKRYPYISILKILGMFAVVAIHSVSTPFTMYCDSYGKIDFFLSVFVVNILKSWAVPVFLMCSGAMFLSKDITIKDLFVKYVRRIILILATFGYFYCVIELFFRNHNINITLLYNAFINLITGNCWNHMWYLYMIIGIYLLVPVLRCIVKNENILKYFIILLFVMTCVIPDFQKLSGLTIIHYFPFNIKTYLLYFVLGYALHKDLFKINKYIAIGFVCICILYTCFGQQIPGFIDKQGANLKFMNLNDLFGVLITVSLFSLIKNYVKKERESKFELFLVDVSLGVYVIHSFYLNIFYKVIKLDYVNGIPVLNTLLVYIFTCILSIGTVFILKRIPFIKKYIL